MKFTDLRPRFMKWAGKGSFQNVETLAEADCVFFLCPLCFQNNSGSVGTHSIKIDFRGRNTPDEDCMHNNEGTPVRWEVSGTGLADLTMAPSILILGGCNWHGWVQNGEIVGGI